MRGRQAAGGGRALIRAQGTEGTHTPHPHRRDLGAAADSEAGRRVGTLCLLLDSVVNLKLLEKLKPTKAKQPEALKNALGQNCI